MNGVRKTLNSSADDAGITLLFFGSIAEKIHTDKKVVSLQELGVDDVQDFTAAKLRDRLAEHFDWPQLLEEQLFCAINQTLTSSDTLVRSGDEVAFFPPVTGG